VANEAHSDRTGGRSAAAALADAAADILGGEWREAGGHRFLVVDRRYAPGHRHGHVAMADALPPSDGHWPRLSLLANDHCPGNLLFIDLETTGLAGGAGTYAFLVGCAWFSGGSFHVRQFVLSSFPGERVLLEAVAQLASTCGTVVTFNGKTFDLPLMETRFVLHRLRTPFAEMPHVDLLHPARRLWRPETEQDGMPSSCRLSVLEQTLCGHVRDGDVPGFEIPARYFQYVRSGDPRPLAAVLEHNRLDLISLALLTARAAQLLDEGPPAATSAREALGLGRLYERGGLTAEARGCYARAAGLDGSGTLLRADAATRADALRAYAVLARRERRYDDAAGAWRRIVEMRGAPEPIRREAIDALAVHHEHRLRDLRAARGFALQSLQLQGSRARQQAVQHRLARLNRKLGDAAVPLF
jgi:uncharacterized protein YprB with RNaseH-like and TPR domain